MKKNGSPMQPNQRLEWIDAARGFAIFGIFIVNTPAFNAPFFLYGGAELYWTRSIDQFIQAVIDIFFQASFYTLFSFLFGFGIQQMADRLQEKQLPFRNIILKRQLILIGFGLIHAFLIWHGDILLTYGLIGMLLFFFLKSRSRTLLWFGLILLIGISVLMTGILYALRHQIQEPINRQAVNQAFANYGEGSLLDIWRQNYQDWVYSNGTGGYIFLIAALLPLFLFGMYVAKKRWLHDVHTHKSALIKIWLSTMLIFLIFKAGPYFFGNPYWMSYAQDSIGGTACAIFYLFSITLLYEHASKIVKPLTYVGRMALTNYLFQSCISFILYYSIGFGLYGDIRPVWSVFIATFIFTLQIGASAWWLRYYKYGPVEWLWRSLTYGKKQKMKRISNERGGEIRE